MRYHVLGPLHIVDADGPHTIGSPSQRLILAVVLAHRGTAVTTDALIDAIWDDPPATAVSTLRTYVSRLRHLVGDDLTRVGSGYRLDVDPLDVDAARFEARLGEAASQPPVDALPVLDDALSMWRGAAFGDLADHPLLVPAARRLEELHQAAREARLNALLASGEPARVIADAEAMLAEHPHRERVWVTLVDALLTEHRAADATRAVTRARESLADLGLDPSQELRRAEQRALGIEAAPVADTSTSRSSFVASRHAAPRRASAFIGRQALLDEIADLVSRSAVVTLVGPGGVGKTRLAHEVLGAVASRHRDGCQVVDLGTLTDGDDVLAAIVSGLGLITGDDAPAQALARAGALDLIVLLDNADHVIDRAAHAVVALTSSGGALRILVTSRERLGVDGEQVRAIRPLPGDTAGSPARQLFRDRAEAVGCALDHERDETLVARVVSRLDGLPLAIEMAAAQLTSCTMAELVELLDTDLGELRSADRSAPTRHRSLGELIDWSLDGLDPDQATILHQLCAFAGSFTADDVSGVLGHRAVSVTRRLADRSLVGMHQDVAANGSRTSFRVLHVVRSHVVARLGPVDAEVRRDHARWCLARAQDADRTLATFAEPDARRSLSDLVDDLRSAHRWATEEDRTMALAMSRAIHRFALCGLIDELLSWADRLLEGGARPDDPIDDVVVAMTSSATRLIYRGDHSAADSLARRALALEPGIVASLPVYEAIGDIALYDGRTGEAIDAYRELAERASTIDERWYQAVGETGIVLASIYGGLNPPPLGPDDPSTPPSSRAWRAYARAEACAEDDPHAALQHTDTALELARSIPNRIIEGVTLVSVATLRHRTDGARAALGAFRAACSHWLRLGDRSHQATTLRNLVVAMRDLDRVAEVADLVAGLDATDVPTYGAESDRLSEVREWLAQRRTVDDHATNSDRGASRDVADLAVRSIAVIDALLESAPD